MIFGDIDRRVVTLLVLAVSFVVGCEFKKVTTSNTAPSNSAKGGSNAASEQTGKASETVSADGSSTVYPLCQALAVEFERDSKHKVSVGSQGTGGGYKRFMNRQADIWNASRPIDEKEIEELKKKGIEWLELNVAVDGIVIAVHPQNTWCTQLTCAQLKRIWEPDSQVKNWSDLDPAWPAEPMMLYGADTDSGTFDYFTEVINGKRKATNTNYTPASNDNILVQGIAANKNSLGYIPFGYYVENTDKLKPIAISPTKEATENPAPAVEPNEDSILSGEYTPLARPLFMYVNRDSMTRHEVTEFLTFAVSDTAQPLVAKRGFVRVKDDVRKQMQKKLEDAIAGLHSSTK